MTAGARGDEMWVNDLDSGGRAVGGVRRGCSRRCLELPSSYPLLLRWAACSVVPPVEDPVATGCDWFTPVGAGQGGVIAGRRGGPAFFARKVDRRRTLL